MSPARRWRGAIRVVPCLIVPLLSACGLNRDLARRAEAVVAAERPAAVACDRADRCAMPSPYRRLVLDARASDTPAHPVHHVNLLERGEDALIARIHLIRSARRSIDLQTFIWAEDSSGWLMLDELLRAARRGVKVRVLADQLFSLDDVNWLARIARAHANLEFRLYNPTFNEAVTQPLEFAAGVLCCFSRFNQRMHNKLLLVDGEIGIVGGRNVEDRYFDWDPEFDYRDRDVLVVGPQAGAAMQASFDAFWNHRRARPLTRLNDVNARLVAGSGTATEPSPPRDADWARIEAARARAGDADWIERHFVSDAIRTGRVAYFSDAPDKAENRDDPRAAALTEHIVTLLEGARGQIVLETPYLVLSRRAQKVFRAIAERDPRPEIIVSTNSLAATDAFYVYALSYKYKKRYLKYGFRIHEFKPFPGDAQRFVAGYATLAGGDNRGEYERYGRTPLKRHGARLGLHAKSLVIDDTIAMIGSHNFDPRSDDYNTESGFIFYDRAVAERLRAAILLDVAPQNAWIIARSQRAPKLIGKLNNIINDISTALPIFDLWPFRYATSYELKPGCEPMGPRDKRFYECHEDVGDFPEVDLPLKTIYTRIVTAFGAGLAGFL